jgi:serine/threonine-protein phosphatase 2A activator
MAVVDEYADAYLYMGCVKFIRDIKHGPFHETSPMLFDISGVESWEKINGGMIKMYCAELLAKRQIVQHFLFGSIIQL